MSSVGGDVARRLVETRARRALWENRGVFSLADQGDRQRDGLELGRAFLPGLSRNDAKALAQLAALVEDRPDADAPSTFEQFRALSTVQARVQARRVGEIAFRSLDDPAASVRELGVDLLRDLAAFRSEPLGHRIQQTLREKEIFQPGLLYRDAGIAEARASGARRS